MSDRPGPEKLSEFQWWLCFWLAMMGFNMPGKARVNVYVDGKQIEHTQGGHHEVRCDANRPT